MHFHSTFRCDQSAYFEMHCELLLQTERQNVRDEKAPQGNFRSSGLPQQRDGAEHRELLKKKTQSCNGY